MNSDEASFAAARDLLAAHLEGRFADVTRLARAADSDVLMAVLTFAAASLTSLVGGDDAIAVSTLRDLYDQMRQVGGLEFPDPFEGL